MKVKLSGFQWLMVGSNIVATFIISVFVGVKLDIRLNSKPKWTLIMLAIALISVFMLFLRLLKAVERDSRL